METLKFWMWLLSNYLTESAFLTTMIIPNMQYRLPYLEKRIFRGFASETSTDRYYKKLYSIDAHVFSNTKKLEVEVRSAWEIALSTLCLWLWWIKLMAVTELIPLQVQTLHRHRYLLNRRRHRLVILGLGHTEYCKKSNHKQSSSCVVLREKRVAFEWKK